MDAVIEADVDAATGVPLSGVLRRFANSVVTGSHDDVSTARSALLAAASQEAVVDAAAVIAFFNAFDRVADATGTVSDEPMRQVVAHILPNVNVAAMIGSTAR